MVSPSRVRISIRYKLLAVITALLLVALGAYVYLATTLFNRDKLAYVFDANAALVESLADQTQANLTALTQILTLFGRDVATARDPASASLRSRADETFVVEPDLVRIEVYRRDRQGALVRFGAWDHPGQLEALGLSARDLEAQERADPLPVDALAERPGELVVRNVSLAPDVPLLAAAVGIQTGDQVIVVAARLRHDRLLHIFGRSGIGSAALLDHSGVVLAHPDAAQVIARAARAEHPLVGTARQGSVDRGVREYATGEGVQMLGAFGRVSAGNLLVITETTRDAALSAGRELVRRSVYFGAAVLLASVLVTIFLSRFVTSPIRRLRAATEVVAQGRFDFKVDERSADEIGDLARSFVRMSHALRDAQAQLVRSEKLAAFGQLGAGITHELKNPLTGIVGFAQIGQRKVDQPEKVTEMLRLIETEGLRCKDILVNFLKFARQQSGHDALRVDVNELVESSAKIVRHQLAIHNVSLDLELARDAGHVVANGGELQQVILNLALNAQQAMPAGGHVKIFTRREDGGAVIGVQDDGPGIPAELREKIFEPFFSTKPPGEGTGLGLAISFGIVRDHGGTLTVQSEVGKGTTFRVELPAATPVHEVVVVDDRPRKVSGA